MKHTFVILGCIALAACASAPPAKPAPTTVNHAAADDPPGATPTVTPANRDVVALVDGRPVTWSALHRPLTEAAGGTVLAEWVLDRKITEALAAKNLSLTQQEVDGEKAALLDTLADDHDEATRLLDRLRDERGLGTARFDSLLRRNAGLRKLIADEVKVTEPMVREAWEGRYGPRTEVRMILTGTLPEAAGALKRARAGESFSDLAVALSRDSSRNQGGLLPPINTQDATFPKAIRDGAARLKVGEISDPIALDAGFAILRCERKINAQDVLIEKVADDLRRRVRLGLERSLMQRQARVLLESADVTAMDAAMNETWKRQRQLMLSPEAGR